ncbi:addiction module toxin RelE/StbE family protein [Secundilactobacillus pentosiphilus]|uniref:Addiction module toxin RelE/StbE family protein n=1 Tax=Secundilactobacillus pentosiphilus TaxID=1714682 RepID=A0A1Z5J062_9LACO|nr:type II toxin-antitoxin system mRNA interferase toxin, RelE/StbE family [Secundilactobacillus pentosiphilus]GAX07111.1 addiction module toxin RelE/StbE family protein [Secundilactobacillus pentosiphilus]
MKIEATTKFLKAAKKLKKKHYNIGKLSDAIQAIVDDDHGKLQGMKHHKLKGIWSGFDEIHIESNWLLIYYIEGDRLKLVLTDTGSHDNLFG